MRCVATSPASVPALTSLQCLVPLQPGALPPSNYSRSWKSVSASMTRPQTPDGLQSNSPQEAHDICRSSHRRSISSFLRGIGIRTPCRRLSGTPAHFPNIRFSWLGCFAFARSHIHISAGWVSIYDCGIFWKDYLPVATSRSPDLRAHCLSRLVDTARYFISNTPTTSASTFYNFSSGSATNYPLLRWACGVYRDGEGRGDADGSTFRAAISEH